MTVYKIDDLQYLKIGVQGENNATKIGIDVSSWVDELAEDYPNLHFHLLFKPYGQSTALPMVTSYNSVTKILTWEIDLNSTYIQGVGYTETRALNFPDDGLLKKSRVIPTLVETSVSGVEGGSVPAPYEDWVNLVLATKDELNEILSNPEVAYQNSDSGTVTPTGTWTDSPYPVKGQYMWTRITYNWSTGAQGTIYTITYIGMDGEGVVSRINGLDGNVVLDGTNVYVDDTVANKESVKAAVERLALAITTLSDESSEALTVAVNTLQQAINNLNTSKLDANRIVYSSTQPSNPTTGMIWLKPK